MGTRGFGKKYRQQFNILAKDIGWYGMAPRCDAFYFVCSLGASICRKAAQQLVLMKPEVGQSQSPTKGQSRAVAAKKDGQQELAQ